MSRPITDREKIALAFLDGYRLGMSVQTPWEEARLIRQAVWKADMLMHPGSVIIWAGDQTFPESKTPAPPALERLPKSLEVRDACGVAKDGQLVEVNERGVNE